MSNDLSETAVEMPPTTEPENVGNIASAQRDTYHVVAFGEAMIRLTPPRN